MGEGGVQSSESGIPPLFPKHSNAFNRGANAFKVAPPLHYFLIYAAAGGN